MARAIRIRAIKTITSPDTNELRREEAHLRSFAAPGTTIDLVRAQTGTATIESFTDVALAAIDTLRLTREAEHEGYDGVLITCWGNANLEAAREISSIPVTASGEASMLLAAALGACFSVVAPLDQTLRHAQEAWKLGLERKFRSERPLGIRVHGIKSDWEATKAAFIEAGRKCVELDGAHVLIPGCANLSGLAAEMQSALGVPVVEPAGAGVRHLETMIQLGLCHSKRTWPVPLAKHRDYGFGDLGSH